MPKMNRALAALVLALPPLCAQGTGSVAGTVISGISGTGVAGMNVLLWARGGAQYQATTDDSGSFRIDDVQPGSYRARFEKEGYMPLQQDQPLTVAPAAEPARLRVEMTPYATLRGRVLDPEGKPAANVEVELRRAQGGVALDTSSPASDGSFVFDRLVSGSYLLLAKPKTESDGSGTALVSTYFPSVEERAQAERILVRGGIDLAGYEIRLRTAPVYRISGTVVDESGKPVPGASVALISTAEGMSAAPGYGDSGALIFGILKQESETGVTSGEDGRFAFTSVHSGSWRVSANDHGSGGAVALTVADHDLTDVQIQVTPLFTLTGTAEFTGGPPTKDARYGRIMLTTTDAQGSILFLNRADGSLRVPNLMPGTYRVSRVPGPAGSYLPTSVLLGDREVLGQIVQLTAASPPLRIVYSVNTGVVRGTVEQGDCALVALLPKPLVPPVLSRTEACKVGGPFEISGVPPGQYYVLAFDRVDPAVPLDEAFLRSATVNAPAVEVGQGPAASIQLTITHWPD